MSIPDSQLWSTPKFFAIALLIHFVSMFVMNGLLNMILHLNVPAPAIGVGPSIVLVLLLPRWRWYAQWVQRRNAAH